MSYFILKKLIIIIFFLVFIIVIPRGKGSLLQYLGGFKSLLDRKNFKPQSLRGCLMGVTIMGSMGELTAYKLINKDVDAGEIPYYTPDMLIVALSAFEALIAPFISWWGYRKRRAVLIWYLLIASVCLTPWFFMPTAGQREELGLCNNTLDLRLIYTGMTSNSITRLVLTLFTCIFIILARVTCWSHGIAYIDEYAPENMSTHYGILVVARVLVLIFGNKMMMSAFDSFYTLHIVGIMVGLATNVIQVPFIIPKVVPEVDGVQKTPIPLENRGFLITLGRIFCNPVAMMQMFAMGLMAAALWGYGYNEIDIIKVKFNFLRENNILADYSDFLIYHFVVIAVLFAAAQYSPPILMEFCNLKAIKQVILMSVAACIIYVVITTVTGCDRGDVAGLNQTYGSPQCSLSCNCNPRWQEYKPVCMVDNMVTYLSPCQAGCANSEVLNGIQVYGNCTCSPTGRVILGACSDVACKTSYRLHSALFIILAAFTLLILQAQGVLLLRVIDPRDKSTVIGLMLSTVAMIAFACGHLTYFGIRAWTCAWNEEKLCLLQKLSFPYYVGGTSAVMALGSSIISIISWLLLRVSNTDKSDNYYDEDVPLPLIRQ